MRIGLPGLGRSVDQIVRQAERAEADGFSSLWYTTGVGGDPMTAIAIAGRSTTRIEFGTAIMPTYACHPVSQASRAAATAAAIGTPGRFTLGIGPSHQPFVEPLLGLSYATPGRNVEEYTQIVVPLLQGQAVNFRGEDYRVTAGPPDLLERIDVPVLISALGPRLLRVAGQYAAGTIPWLANVKALETHIVPRITKAAADAGRPAPRIAAGLPVAVHDDEAEARAAAAEQFGVYSALVNYQRIFERGGIAGPADAAIVGDEASVTAQVVALFDAGATDVWLAVFPVGADRSASRLRTRALLKELAAA